MLTEGVHLWRYFELDYVDTNSGEAPGPEITKGIGANLENLTHHSDTVSIKMYLHLSRILQMGVKNRACKKASG